MKAKALEQWNRAVKAMLSEHTEGFVLLAFIPGHEDPLLVTQSQDQKTHLALTHLADILPQLMEANRCSGGEDPAHELGG